METPSQSGAAGLEPLLVYASASTLVAILLALAALQKRRRAVGRLLGRESGSPLARRVAITAACALAVGILLRWDELGDGAPVLATLLLATVAFVVCPSERDARIGDSGVAHGWDSRSFRELEEWRLTGEHLRWRIGSRWVACRLPVAEHEALRERLAAACGERESRFRD